MDSNSEDNDAKDAEATTPCGLPAAMDSSAAPKTTSLMKIRNHSNQRNGSGARTSKPSSQVLIVLDSDVLSDDLQNNTINFKGDQSSPTSIWQTPPSTNYLKSIISCIIIWVKIYLVTDHGGSLGI